MVEIRECVAMLSPRELKVPVDLEVSGTCLVRKLLAMVLIRVSDMTTRTRCSQ